MERRSIIAGVALTIAAMTASAQTAPQTATMSPCKVWYGTTTTDANGKWSVAFPSGTFTAPPVVTVTPVSADATLPNQALPQMTAPTATGVSGTVAIPNTVLVAGAPFKAGGAGIVVQVQAIGY